MRLPILAFLIVIAGGAEVMAQALGFGTETRGGLDGRVVKVTTLANDGPGSLRAAVAEDGPRVIVFEVAGVIALESKLVIGKPGITIAGQTAPTPGVTITQAGFVVKTHDVVIEHLKFRIGDGPGPDAQNRDAIAVDGSKDGTRDVFNVVIDNCSVSWAIDEGVQVYRKGVRDVTIRDSIIAANLSDSIHPKGPHSMGLLVGQGTDRVSVVDNVFAHNSFRNPAIEGGGKAFVANNLIYNYEHRAIQFYGGGGGVPAEATIVGNVALIGPNHSKDALVFLPKKTNPGTLVYMADNRGTAGDEPGDYLLVADEVADQVQLVAEPPLWPNGFVVRDPDEVLATILETAGARPAERDAVDREIIADIENRTGEIIDAPPPGALESVAPAHRPLAVPDALHDDPDGDGRTTLDDWLDAFRRDVEHPA
ncbi:MAG: right-handed parallel beta-helix repeat-containing protein [Geminicoccaceae bacterium]